MRERARLLRRSGESINDIVHTLKAKKSTVSYWCRDIRLSQTQIEKLAQKSLMGGRVGMLRAAEHKRQARIMSEAKEMRRGGIDVGSLSKRDVFMIGIALYWGEGYKRGNEECGLTNSDPRLIKFFLRMMRSVYGIAKKDFILRVSINATHKRRADEILEYWSKVTGIPKAQFTQSSFIFASRRKITRDPSGYFGTLRVKIRRGTNLRRRILGSIAEIQKQTTQ
jgi:hypothetical protein